MSRAELIEQLKKRFDGAWRGASPEIVAAITTCISSLSIRDSRCSPVSSIPRKVAVSVDQPFINFANDFHFPPPEWKFSDLIKLELGLANYRLAEWSKNHLETLEILRQPKYESAGATIGLLRDFLARCAIHVPGEQPALRISKDGHLAVDTTKVRRRKNLQLSDKLAHYLQFFHEGYCELCFEFTAGKMKLDEMVHLAPELEPEIVRLVKDEAPFKAKGHSPTYCRYHSRRSARGADEKRRLHFYSAMRLIVDVGDANRAGSFDPSDLRRYAYWIAYLPGRMSPALKHLPNAVASYHAGKCHEVDASKINELTVLLCQLEKESTVWEQWTKRCLKTPPSIFAFRLTDEEWRRNVESEYAEWNSKRG